MIYNLIMRDNIYNDDDRQYLQMMQENIERMSSNSANCKTWLVALVAAFLTMGVSFDAFSGWLFLALFPILILWLMDAYYLKLERGMRNREQLFINTVTDIENNEEKYKALLFNFKPFDCSHDDESRQLVSTRNTEWSNSISPFYLTAFVLVLIVSLLLYR